MDVEIEDQKYQILEVRAEEKGFEDTEEYIDHLLEQIVEKIRKEKSEESYTSEQEQEVKSKLKDLGYMG